VRRALLLIVLGAACTPAREPPVSIPAVAAGELRPVATFDRILDREDRSRALFLEATRVLLHPRCVNCHPAGDAPAQGDRGAKHDPPVSRGPNDHGIVGLECASCHQDRNLELARVPGAPDWHLAPKVMAWASRSPREICEQIKDPSRNGKKTLAQIVEHSAHDPLVAWGWSPGHGRAAAPGTQAAFGELIAAWVKSGAACPKREER
jgi:hypothetical protein